MSRAVDRLLHLRDDQKHRVARLLDVAADALFLCCADGMSFQCFFHRQDVLSVPVFILHPVHFLFYHVDAEAADSPLLRRERDVRVGLCKRIVGDAAVNQRDGRYAVRDFQNTFLATIKNR